MLNLTRKTAEQVDLVVVGDRTAHVENLIQLAKTSDEFDLDVLHFRWVDDCIQRGQLLLYFPWSYYRISPSFSEIRSLRYWVCLSKKTRCRLLPVMDVDLGVVWGQLPDRETCKQVSFDTSFCPILALRLPLL